MIDVKPTIASIVATLHHPFNSSQEVEIQGLMVAEVLDWCTNKARESPEDYSKFLHQLSRPYLAAKQGEEAEQIAHTHVPAFTAAYASANKVGGTTVHDLITVGVTGPRASFIEKISRNIEKSMEKGSMGDLSMKDLPGIKKIMESSPSSDTPNPIDEALTMIPGMSLFSVFDGIDLGEIVAAPGMGIILKDTVITMRLKDTELVEREQIAARERLGALEDRPTKEILQLLDFGARTEDDKERERAERPTEESKTRKLMNKLKFGKS